MRRGSFPIYLSVGLCVLLLGLSSCQLIGPAPRKFSRGIWVNRWDYQTEEDVRQIFRNVAAMGFDHVLFQARGNGDALYRSRLEPWSELLGGKDPGYDPLGVAVEMGKSLGVKVQAWVNVVPGWRGGTPPRSANQLYHTHPEWFLVMRNGRRQALKDDYYVGLNTCLPEVRTYLAKVIADIAARYDLDAIHLDYIRFMEKKKGEDFPYDAKTLRLYAMDTGLKPAQDPERWDAWRRAGVDLLVRKIRQDIQLVKPRMRLTVAAIRDQFHARRDLFQDVRLWARMGWVDAIYPMTYIRKSEKKFFAHAEAMVSLQRFGVQVFPGIGSFLHRQDPQVSVRQIRLARNLEAAGISIYAYAALFPSKTKDPGKLKPAEQEKLRQALAPVIAKPGWF